MKLRYIVGRIWVWQNWQHTTVWLHSVSLHRGQSKKRRDRRWDT